MNERGDGEIRNIIVIIILVIIVTSFPQTVKGFVAWVGDSVYAVFDAGPSPFSQKEEEKKKEPAKDPAPEDPAKEPEPAKG